MGTANIKTDSILFKQNHILVKLREYKINDKIENMTRCVFYGNKVKAKVYDLDELSSISPTPRSRFPGPIRPSSNWYRGGRPSSNGYQGIRPSSNGYRRSNGDSRDYGRNDNNNNGRSYIRPHRIRNGYNNNNYNNYG